MKKLILFLLVVGALYYLAKSDKLNVGAEQGPGVIANPVYAVIRFRTAIHDRTFDMVAMAKAVDQADCRHMADDLVGRMQSGQEVWQLVSSDCKQALDSRNAKLFENKPTFVNYVSAAPGAATEREVRLIFWGVTADEGELVCNQVQKLKERWKGTVTCIRALASQ